VNNVLNLGVLAVINKKQFTWIRRLTEYCVSTATEVTTQHRLVTFDNLKPYIRDGPMSDFRNQYPLIQYYSSQTNVCNWGPCNIYL